MNHENSGNPMGKNISDVFSPKRRMHVSEQKYDIDVTDTGNPLVESVYKNVYPGSGSEVEREGADDINKDDSLM